jgi:carboxy-cis,cis-muconate cyclase
VHWETPTSGGKSNAIELKAKNSAEGEGYGVWIVLTDDEDDDESNSGAVWVLEWDSAKAKEIKAVAKWDGRGVKGIDEDGEGMAGGSHAIWLD